MKVIGVLGGMSDQATVEYYRLMNDLVRQRLGGSHTAEVVINSVDFGIIERCIREGSWEEAGVYLSAKAEALERAGAELLVCASNTMHRVADAFTSKLTIPFLHIADPTGEAIRASGLKKIGLLGTKSVMSAEHLKRRFVERFDLEILTPREEDQLIVDRVIFDELVRHVLKPESKANYLRIIEGLRMRGAEGVILGCTEICLLVGESDTPGFPLFDTASLHVRGALAWAFA
ncbi:MAG: amino acid racemase [Spirochaetota bacterium]